MRDLKTKKIVDVIPIMKFIEDGLNNPDRLEAFGYDAIEILAELEFADTIDAVEVIRCKDCKNWREGFTGSGMRINTWCPLMNGSVTKDNDFCSYGERREENGK